MSNATFSFLKKILLTSVSRSFILAVVCAVLICTPHGVLAQATAKIEVTHPTKDGTVEFTLDDHQSGNNGRVVADDILKTDTCWTKARKIARAVRKAIRKYRLADTFSVSRVKNIVTITNVNKAATDWWILNPQDSTGENSGLKINEQPLDWSFDLHVISKKAHERELSGVVPPSGTVMTMTVKVPGGFPLSVSVTGDGILTADQLLRMALDQFETLGFTFTEIIDPITGRIDFVSQWFPVAAQRGAGWVRWNRDWSTYLGGAGVGAAAAQ